MISHSLRWSMLALLCAACVKIAPSGNAAGPGRVYDTPMEETIATVRDAVRQAGLIVAFEQAINQNEWALDARTGSTASQTNVRVTVQRADAGSRVNIEQSEVKQPPVQGPELAQRKGTNTRTTDYAAQIYKVLDQKLREGP